MTEERVGVGAGDVAFDAFVADVGARVRRALVPAVGCRWSPPEVAEVLGVGVPTVRNHTARGLASLRKALGVDA